MEDLLLKQYPWMDSLMASTLISAYERGTLSDIMERSKKPPEEGRDQVIEGAVVIEKSTGSNNEGNSV